MSALRVERDGEILRVTLARPERRNAFDADLIRELGDAFADVGDARAVVLAGDGPSFCAGADVEWQRSSIEPQLRGERRGLPPALPDARRRSTAARRRWSSRVQGYALGGGSGLTACADIAIAAEDAVFGFSEVRLGIIPGGDLADGAGEDRPGRSAAVLPHRRAVRRADGAPDRPGRRGRRRPRRGGRRASSTAILAGGPTAVREAKRLVLEPGDEEDLLARAASAGEPRGPGRARAFLDSRGGERVHPSWQAERRLELVQNARARRSPASSSRRRRAAALPRP